MPIEAVPTWYRGTRFASTLEAAWAAMFDRLGWDSWEYEPEAVRLRNGEAYRPDFYLRAQRVWCEVKGPHNERLEKTRELQETLNLDQEEWSWSSQLVVVLRPPGPGETAQWHGALPTQDIVLIRCRECDHYAFMDYAGAWLCRHHPFVGHDDGRAHPWLNGGEFLRPGDATFTRAPRPKRRGGEGVPVGGRRAEDPT